MNVDDVTEILRSYYFDVIDREYALDSLEDASTFDLYLAEVELLDEGFKEHELKKIGKLYVDLIKGNSKKLLKELDDDHPIKGLIIDHEKIEGFMFKLDELSSAIKTDISKLKKEVLEAVMYNLSEIDKHLEREERALFSELRSVNGSLKVRLRMLTDEHVEFREHRNKLEDLLSNIEENQEEIVKTIDSIIYMLRYHKFIEGDLLYPVALREINDWKYVKMKAKMVGNCEFVPIPS